MGWLANFAAWIDGTTVPHVTDFQNITADIHTWGGTVDAAGYGLSNAGFAYLSPGELTGTTHTVTAASWAASVATYTIGSHNLQVGQLVSITGITPTGYNVTQVPVTAVTSTTVSVAMSSNPGAWSSGGTSQADGTAAAEGMFKVDQNGNPWIYGSAWIQLAANVSGPITTGEYFAGPGIANVTLANGTNENVNIGNNDSVTLMGPTASFSIGGFTGGVSGRRLYIYQSLGQTMTINNLDAGSSSANQIVCPGLANFTPSHTTGLFLCFVWESKWILQAGPTA